MPVRFDRNGNKLWQRRTRLSDWLRYLGWLLIVALFVFCWRLMTKDTIWLYVLDSPRQGVDIVSRMWPLSFGYLWQLWEPLWATINMATLGTLLAIVLALPFAFLSAIKTTPNRYLLRSMALLVISASRSINSIIWTMLLVAIIGPGVLAGVIAIALRSFGFISKLLYEAIDEVSNHPLEAIRATGASGPQVLAFGIWPQITPAFVGISLFRWDINIREATVLGLVGAGGIGVNLEASINLLAWPQVAVILAVILATVIFSEWLSAAIRQSLI